MTEDERYEEARGVARFRSSQRRRVAAHAAKYGWRDGTTEVETAGMLVVTAIVCAVVTNVPAASGFRALRVEAIALLIAILVVAVEALATGFRYHVSQGVGGLVGRPRVDRVHLAGGGVALAISLVVLVAAVAQWTGGHPAAWPLPLGGIAGTLGALGALLGAFTGTRRIIITSTVIASVGFLADWVVSVGGFVGPNGFALGLLALAVVPLVSGVVGFHQYRRDVSERHEEYVADAIGLISSPKPAQRAVAAEALGRLGGLEVAEPLVVALGDRDEDVRLASAIALSEIRELVPIRLVARRLDLRGFGPEDSVPPDEIAECAQLAMLEWQDTLAERYREVIKDPRVLDSLIAVTGADQPAAVRRAATRVLAETRDSAAIAHLATLLADEHHEVRASARGALAWTGPAGAQAVAALLTDTRDVVRREAVAALLGLVRYAEDAEDTRVEQELLDDLLPETTERADDPAREWQLVAAMAEDAFSCALCDRDEMVREAAALGLDLLHEASGAVR